MLEPPFNEFEALQACNFIKETPTRQVFSRETRKISKNTYSEEHLRTTASVCYNKNIRNNQNQNIKQNDRIFRVYQLNMLTEAAIHRFLENQWKTTVSESHF